ncbi:membrane associated rhomboid family serine protease [Arcanobacterium pluranimalium]|uniref:rhomboid family intramembrane serine protease n=1 Tax=Arcanobacterium pluranimalium TaxID=108028 RepID=UPI00195C3C6B|nr:rhomboid family intramembrane serine protease [Arcanobacterium pluranimalium]MBM7824427.1 membrane associated rhomboid family serine protease [Arcanobacterium pluranimalium]
MTYYSDATSGSFPPHRNNGWDRTRQMWRSSSIPVTTAFIGICVAVAVIEFLFPQVGIDLLFFPPLAFDEPYRFVTSAFLHGGIMHLLLNMYALWMLGMALEQRLGRWRYIGLLVVSAICGNLAVYAYSWLSGNWAVAAVGASGAVFGLFGAMLLLARGSSNFRGIFVLLVVNLMMSFMIPQISWESHVGGLMGGLVFTALFCGRKYRSRY